MCLIEIGKKEEKLDFLLLSAYSVSQNGDTGMQNSFHLYQILTNFDEERPQLLPLSDKIIRYDNTSEQDHSNFFNF